MEQRLSSDNAILRQPRRFLRSRSRLRIASGLATIRGSALHLTRAKRACTYRGVREAQRTANQADRRHSGETSIAVDLAIDAVMCAYLASAGLASNQRYRDNV